ncbi:hypothetical protein NX774_10140 [Massilia agilis]|uniref:Cell envelope biogenesis protein TolA n=1 Tax=Massilia agilis TaxID=1811226 RepID=A0ABT2DCY0_9BURK|nr:hypothetical protein [Massilia agilis]MCS0808278.1 hypothetical protein [Massilia agilis]
MRPMDVARAVALAGALGAFALAQAQQMDDSTVAPAVAQKQKQEIAKGDPSRWYTPADEARNKEKEIGAAYAEAKAACREAPKDQRAACLKDARTTYEQDMADARKPASPAKTK